MAPDFRTDLPRLVRELEKDSTIRALAISAKGKHFKAGMDLSSFNSIAALMDAAPRRAAYALRDLVFQLQDAFNVLEDARFPVIWRHPVFDRKYIINVLNSASGGRRARKQESGGNCQDNGLNRENDGRDLQGQ